MTTLFRPVGLEELSLIWDTGMRQFPPRLPHQPIFYPVANVEYATQIGRDWNTKDESSGFAGYVTKFVVPGTYLADFQPHTVGASTHVEYWIPAVSLSSFNAAIEGLIIVEAAYFGNGFKGYVPEKLELRDKDVVGQFVVLSRTWEQNRMNFANEVAANRKAVYLNFMFWSQFDFAGFGVDEQRRDATIARIMDAWNSNQIEIPLPERDCSL